MRRRTYVTGAIAAVTLAGCMGDSGDEEPPAENNTSPDTGADPDDSPSEYARMAENLAAAIEEEYELVTSDDHPGWEIENGTIHVRFYEVHGEREELDTIARVYAIVVESGFDLDASFSAIDPDDGARIYTFDIREEWADAYNADASSFAEYTGRIEDTLA